MKRKFSLFISCLVLFWLLRQLRDFCFLVLEIEKRKRTNEVLFCFVSFKFQVFYFCWLREWIFFFPFSVWFPRNTWKEEKMKFLYFMPCDWRKWEVFPACFMLAFGDDLKEIKWSNWLWYVLFTFRMANTGEDLSQFDISQEVQNAVSVPLSEFNLFILMSWLILFFLVHPGKGQARGRSNSLCPI